MLKSVYSRQIGVTDMDISLFDLWLVDTEAQQQMQCMLCFWFLNQANLIYKPNEIVFVFVKLQALKNMGSNSGFFSKYCH